MNNYTQKTIETLQTAKDMAQENGNSYLMPEHLLYALIDQEGGFIPSLFGKMGIDCDSILAQLDTAIAAMPKTSGSGYEVYLDRSTDKVMQDAAKYARSQKDEYISVEHIMMGIFDNMTPAIKDIFRRSGALWEREEEEHIEFAHAPEMLCALLEQSGFTDVRILRDGPMSEAGRLFCVATNLPH